MPKHDTHAHHTHDRPGAHSAINKAFGIGIFLNTSFVIVEFAYGLNSHSLALLSDAGHNLSDVLGLLIAWVAVLASKALPTKRRTYGLRRSSILAALANALILLVAVGGIVWEALQRFVHPEPVLGNVVMLVAGIGVIINSATAFLFMSGRKEDLNVQGAYIHMAADAAVSLGVVFSGLVMRLTGWNWLDPVVSIVIAIVIIWGTWRLLRASVDLAMDAVPEGVDIVAVEAYLVGISGVDSLHDLHIWGMSTTEFALTVHMVMPEPPTNDEFFHDIQHHLKDHFKIGHSTIQVEHGSLNFTCHQSNTNSI